jgi:hypothetical protein
MIYKVFNVVRCLCGNSVRAGSDPKDCLSCCICYVTTNLNFQGQVIGLRIICKVKVENM